jgi:Delta14-sterol reductase
MVSGFLLLIRFMLLFGDLVWVPFTYALQAKYLSMYPQYLTLYHSIAILGLNLLGLYIFRSANSEKNAFRNNPEQHKVAHLKYLTTKRGTKLLVSGWWGMARKINYTGIQNLSR